VTKPLDRKDENLLFDRINGIYRIGTAKPETLLV
jgi:hypothetical protein